jgi:hypothetical protein
MNNEIYYGNSDEQLALIHSVLAASRKDYTVYEFRNIYAELLDKLKNNQTNEDTSIPDEAQDIVALSSANGMINVYINYVPTDKTRENFLFNLYRLSDSRGCIYSTNQARGDIRRNIIIKKSKLLYSYDLLFPKFVSPVFDNAFENAEFADTLAHFFHRQHFEQFLKKNLIEYNDTHNMNESKHVIVNIPKEMQLKLLKPGKFFSEISSLLHLSKESNFYTYSISGQEIPVLCKHEYMLYNNEPLDKIADECYKFGKCKFCNQELVAYHERGKEMLHPASYNIIYQFIECFNEHIDETRLLNYICNILIDELKPYTDITSVKELAFTSVFLLKIHTLTKGVILYNSHFHSFQGRIKENCANAGWPWTTVQRIVGDENEFTGLKDCLEIVKSFRPMNLYEQHPDISIVSALFEKVCNLGDKLVATTKIQEIYLKGEVVAFNRAITDNVYKNWNMKKYFDPKSRKITVSKVTRTSIDKQPSRTSLNFFQRVWFSYCPAGGVHNFVKKICKHCGIDDAGSNLSTVFQKYEHVISNLYSEPYAVPDIKKERPRDIIKELAAEEPIPFPTLNTNMLERLIAEIPNHDTEIIKFIKSALSLPSITLPENVLDFILKALTYMGKNKFSEQVIYQELINICFPIRNMLNIISFNEL